MKICDYLYLKYKDPARSNEFVQCVFQKRLGNEKVEKLAFIYKNSALLDKKDTNMCADNDLEWLDKDSEEEIL